MIHWHVCPHLFHTPRNASMLPHNQFQMLTSNLNNDLNNISHQILERSQHLYKLLTSYRCHHYPLRNYPLFHPIRLFFQLSNNARNTRQYHFHMLFQALDNAFDKNLHQSHQKILVLSLHHDQQTNDTVSVCHPQL